MAEEITLKALAQQLVKLDGDKTDRGREQAERIRDAIRARCEKTGVSLPAATALIEDERQQATRAAAAR